MTTFVTPSSKPERIAIKTNYNQSTEEHTPVYDLNPDSAVFDSFARLRVSEPQTLFDSKQIHSNQALFWDDQETSGGGTASNWSQDTASSVMTVSATTAGTRIRQTFRRFNYQPGKSQLILITGTLNDSGGGSGITRCMGMYDDNNGILLQDAEGTINIVKRSSITGSPVDTQIAQTDWNLDKMDGTGNSGVSLDLSKSQILIIDMEWLGVGRVRVGFVINGIPVYAHEFLHSNAVSGVYMSTPNLPLRYEIQNDGTGAASGIEHICTSVVSEGGAEDIGINRCNGNGVTTISAAASGTVYALCGIRLNASNLDAVAKVISLSVMNTGNGDYEWILIFNPTIAGTAPTFNQETNSPVDFAVGIAANTVTNGTPVIAGYVKGGNQSGQSDASLETSQILGSKIDGTQDEVWVCVRNVSGTCTMLASIAWREVS